MSFPCDTVSGTAALSGVLLSSHNIAEKFRESGTPKLITAMEMSSLGFSFLDSLT